MISYMHLPIVVLCFFMLMGIRRWWICIDRMRYTREVGRRAPSMVHNDILAAVFAIMPFLIAAVDWLGVTLPRQPAPISSSLAVFFSMGCLGACVFILSLPATGWQHSGERFALHWIGTWESALRTVAILNIISEAELDYALNYIQTQNTYGAWK